ncbi:MAG: hypothetical protein C4583_11425 [Anaerolineaceae bacterium]|nr:MAG: hypothetical protein C4583_11425 [Anaerolineaceae bacterium]
MLSPISRLLTYTCAVLYLIFGGLLFFIPESLAPVFAWKVTAFMTMTIGGWCLGNAWLAFVSARRWEWGIVHSALLYLWLFGILETGVLFLFRDKLNLSHPIAWMYLATLLVNVLTALVGLVDWLRLRPSLDPSSPRISSGQTVTVILFVLFVGSLGIYGMIAQNGWVGTNGGIFPEVMSLFTLRSFGVFYFSLALAVVPYLWTKNFNALLHHSYASYGLIFFITAAAFVYLGLFDFAKNPGGLLYFAAYLGVGIPVFFVLLKYRKSL